jgi:hypothetical protein
MSELTLEWWLRAVATHRTKAREALLAEGVHPKVIYRKAESAARRGYADYGVVADRQWLTPKGIAYLAKQTQEHPPA